MTLLQDRIHQYIHTLSAAIGARPSGSPANHAAAAYIRDEMRRLGFEVEEQPFECPEWQVNEAALRVGDRQLEVLPNAYSPSCQVEAPLVWAGTLAELEAASLKGKIAVLYGDLTKAPVACKAWFLKDEHDDRIIQALEQKQPAAVLCVQVQPGSVIQIFEDWEFHLPSATIPVESARVLLQAGADPVSLHIKTEQKKGSTANIVGRRAGKRPETIVLCAHYDTKFLTPGALDNAGGVAAILAAAELAGQADLETSLELVAFTNEEHLPLGDDTYFALAGEDFPGHVLLAINFDGAGHILDVNNMATYAASAKFEGALAPILAEFPAVQRVEPWPESNHSSFVWRGVPAVAFSSRGTTFMAHQREDTEEWVSPARIEEAARMAMRIMDLVQDKPVTWLRQANQQA
ncbi:MAG TPA: M28 family peptidase [Anaerolineaceae bacterium]|nr:M28 family peptidase [Anaerolineaceae bacterium]HPN52872.1 M28 family peptidase [Anaerolineaceae bacterium]